MRARQASGTYMIGSHRLGLHAFMTMLLGVSKIT